MGNKVTNFNNSKLIFLPCSVWGIKLISDEDDDDHLGEEGKNVFLPDLIVYKGCEMGFMTSKLQHNELVALVSWQRKHKL